MRLDPADLLPIRDTDVVGDLRSWRDVELPGLHRRAEIYAWLPPGHDSGTTNYPVLYLHDGHNLFLPNRAFGGATWEVDRAMSTLAQRGLPAIVIGIPCHPIARGDEYTAHGSPDTGGGRAADYAAFLADALKPAVDAALHTLPGPEHTLVAGSSLGAVVSAHLWATRSDVFGGAGLFSPAYYWPTEDLGEQGLRDVEAALGSGRRGEGSRVYLDVGGRENHLDPHIERQYVEHAERLLSGLREAQVPVRYVYDSQGYHFETAWAERFPAAVAWLLSGYAVAPPPYVRADLAAIDRAEPS